MQKVNRSEFTGLEIVSVVVSGLETRVSATLAVVSTLACAERRASVSGIAT